jgi:hypothetical protein
LLARRFLARKEPITFSPTTTSVLQLSQSQPSEHSRIYVNRSQVTRAISRLGSIQRRQRQSRKSFRIRFLMPQKCNCFSHTSTCSQTLLTTQNAMNSWQMSQLEMSPMQASLHCGFHTRVSWHHAGLSSTWDQQIQVRHAVPLKL